MGRKYHGVINELFASIEKNNFDRKEATVQYLQSFTSKENRGVKSI
jgi:hypothetical protein